MKIIKTIAHRFLDQKRKVVIADIGCGTGRYTRSILRHLYHTHVIACDINAKSLRILRERSLKEDKQYDSRLDIILCDIESLPLRSKSVTIVLVIDVLQYFSPVNTVKILYNSLTKGLYVIYNLPLSHKRNNIISRSLNILRSSRIFKFFRIIYYGLLPIGVRELIHSLYGLPIFLEEGSSEVHHWSWTIELLKLLKDILGTFATIENETIISDSIIHATLVIKRK